MYKNALHFLCFSLRLFKVETEGQIIQTRNFTNSNRNSQTDLTSYFIQLPIIFGYVKDNRRKSPAFAVAKSLAEALPLLLLDRGFRLSCHSWGASNTAKGNYRREQLSSRIHSSTSVIVDGVGNFTCTFNNERAEQLF